MDNQDETSGAVDTAAAATAAAYTLVVAHPFGDFERGALITDAAQVAAVVAGENAHHVRKVVR